jgi:hypothetical protein
MLGALAPIITLLVLIVYSTLMYNHRSGRDRVEVVDLDPYGTAAPFVDAAVQSVKDGGELSVKNYCSQHR